MTEINHRRYTIETETIEMKNIQPVFAIGQKKM